MPSPWIASASCSLFAWKVLGLSITPPGCQGRGGLRCDQPSPLLLSARWQRGKKMEDVDNVDNVKNVNNCGNCSLFFSQPGGGGEKYGRSWKCWQLLKMSTIEEIVLSSSLSQVPAGKKWAANFRIACYVVIFVAMTQFCRMAWTNAVLVGEPPSRVARCRVPHRWPNKFLPLLHILIVASWCC